MGSTPLTAEGCDDGVDDHALLTIDIGVRKTKHPMTALRKRRISSTVGGDDLGVAAVLLPIQLDDDTLPEAGEIDDEPVDRDLAAEMEAERDDALPQPVPELHLLRGHAFAERAWDAGGKRRALPAPPGRFAATLPYRGGIGVALLEDHVVTDRGWLSR